MQPPSGSRSLITTRRGHHTTTTLTIRPSPAVRRRPVTLTALVVAAHAAANPASGGSVVFVRGTDVLQIVPLKSGEAKFTISNLPPGRHTISAVYQGDGILHSSVSEAVDIIIHEAPDSAYDGSSGFFSMVMMPEGGDHLLTLESRNDALPATVRSLTNRVASVPTAVEESFPFVPSLWTFGQSNRGQSWFVNADVDRDGLREPLLELRDAEWLPAEVFQTTSEDELHALTAPLMEPTGVATIPGDGYSGGVQLAMNDSLFVPQRTADRVPIAGLLSRADEFGQEDRASIPVIAASRRGTIIRIFEAEEPIAPAEPPAPLPPQPPEPELPPIPETIASAPEPIEIDDRPDAPEDDAAGGFESIFVG